MIYLVAGNHVKVHKFFLFLSMYYVNSIYIQLLLSAFTPQFDMWDVFGTVEFVISVNGIIYKISFFVCLFVC